MDLNVKKLIIKYKLKGIFSLLRKHVNMMLTLAVPFVNIDLKLIQQIITTILFIFWKNVFYIKEEIALNRRKVRN